MLVVIYTPELEVLLIERADHSGFWQSVTGSQEAGETLRQTAVREIGEETGLDESAGTLTDWHMQNEFEIYPQWRWRYPPGVTHNTEHVFGLQVPRQLPVRLAPREHVAHQWLPYDRAAEKVFSWSNAKVLRVLPELARSTA